MNKGKRISVADYLSQQINISGKSQVDIAFECGFKKPNIITMFKQGKTALPINRVPAIAKSLGIDVMHFLRLALQEQQPETWAVIEEHMSKNVITQKELEILDIIRTVAAGQEIGPENEDDANELALLAEKWRHRADALAAAAKERVERKK